MAVFFFIGLVVIVAVQLATGRIGTRGGRAIERDRNTTGFWIGIAFEIVMLVALGAGILTGLAR